MARHRAKTGSPDFTRLQWSSQYPTSSEPWFRFPAGSISQVAKSKAGKASRMGSQAQTEGEGQSCRSKEAVWST